ncbi:histidine--tRNA ligase [Roseivirga thermotolerans]|uniref:Histidine--tRNA ligase n=1 Tax=Roseivirga thermotolerans TaxID=1758176 RepID=A0ABQ3I3E2_9BACT|nr:histidine--tRNA ligase [Roseivirga thermotolerans]GHE60693.1 histidine--tRNA ligase [Roseivirga thermotolerans]
MSKKPSLPKGTRDFGPEQMFKRNFIIETIKKVFEKYGFMPLETPAMENLSVLTGKYGDEGDQLLFRILNSGDFLSKTQPADFEEGTKSLVPKISEKGLKYDLTVPFARYVVMNRNDITFPFKRYQIQPVWRADKPQKGRYREFFQCDADIVGTDSLVCEAELLAMVQEVYKCFAFDAYSISISNRKILEGIAEVCGAKEEFSRFCVILDKLDKIGKEKVFDELALLGLNKQSLHRLDQILALSGNNVEKLDALLSLLNESEIGQKGIAETRETLDNLSLLGFLTDKVLVDFTLARGLSYYTGMIYEVKPTTIKMGTITAGGRYDNLTGVFGLEGISGVGISFGIDRIYDTLEELNLFPQAKARYSKLLIVSFDDAAQKHSLNLLSKLRAAGISAELYPEPAKLKKQLGYADKKGIPYVLLVGSEEMKNLQYTLKYMETGNQDSFSIEDVIKHLLEETN